MSIELQNDTIKHFKTLDYLPMFNYYKTEETKDLRYLLKIEDYEELPEVEVDYLNEVWNDLVLEVQDITIKLNRKSEDIFNKASLIDQKTSDYTLIQNLIKFLWHVKEDRHIKTLEELGYKINTKRDWHQELIRIQKRSQILLPKIEELKDELKSISNVSGNSNIYSEVEAIESHLNRDIDMHKTVMSKWLSMKFKVLKQVNKKK